jgi:hypothetical protein
MQDTHHEDIVEATDAATDRRAFLKSCGRFAAVTPPVVSLLLSTSLSSEAIARSGGGWFGGHHPKPKRPGRRPIFSFKPKRPHRGLGRH